MKRSNDGGSLSPPDPSSGALARYSGDEMSPTVFGDGGAFGAASGGAGGTPVSMQTYLSTLYRHKWLALVVAVLIAGSTIPLVWTLVVPQYRARAVVRVSPIVQRLVYQYEENGVLPLYLSYLNTQVAVMRSAKVLQRVLDMPAVQATTWYNEKPPFGLRAAPPRLQRLRQVLTVSPRRNTELIDVAVTAKTPNDATLMVDAVMEQYLGVVNSTEEENESDRMRRLLERANKLRSEVEQLVRQKNLVSTSLGTDLPGELRSHLTTHLNELEEEYNTLVRDRDMKAWKLAGMREGEASNTDESEEAEDPVVTEAKVRYVDDLEWRRLRRSLDDSRHLLRNLRDQYGELHPDVKRTLSDIEYAEKNLANRELELDDPNTEPIRVIRLDPLGGIQSNASLVENDPVWLENSIRESEHREKQLLDAINIQKEKVIEVSRRAQDLESLQDKIRVAHEDAALVSGRLNVLRTESKAPGRVGIASKAIKPYQPHRDRRILLTIMSLAAAMGAGVGAALLRGFLDPSVRQAGDISAMARVPFLGYIPKVRFESELWTDPPEELQESLRMIRTALLERLNGVKSATVLITSSGAQAGKTSVSILLARSFSHIGKRVLLVDADLRRPSLTKRLGVESTRGLTDVLTGSATHEQAIVRDLFPGVDVLPPGSHASSQDPELMANGVFGQCLKKWKQEYDYVLLDSPPILPVADARIIASQVDGAILTLRVSHCRKASAMDAVSLLESSGCETLGTVLVGADEHVPYLGSYGGQYTYSAQVVEEGQ